MITSGSILLFDGVCNLCNSLVRFIIRRDHRAGIKFAPLQSMAGCSLLSQLRIFSTDSDSVVYITGDKHFLQSSAILHLLKDMGGFWKLFYCFIIVPPVIRDSIYNFIAKNRYRRFGRTDICMVPSSDIIERFL